MKKMLSLLLVLLLLMGLVGCSPENPESKFLGTWEVTKAVINDITFPKSVLSKQGVDLSITFNENGTVVISDSEHLGTKGLWAVSENNKNQIEIIGLKSNLILKENTLQFEIAEGTVLYLEKK